MTFRWERGNETFLGPPEAGEAGSEVRIQIKPGTLGSHSHSQNWHILSYLFIKATMSVMSTILLESQTLAPFKPRVMIRSQNNKNNLKF